MTRLEMNKATLPLETYARRAKKEPVVLTRRGKAVAALVSITDDDLETVSISTNPKFIGILERSLERWRREGGIPLQQVREELAAYNARKKSRKRKRGVA
jgi:antitoxin (DNA-binding transcriptional repressor) of toxin-antitoxin stability system